MFSINCCCSSCSNMALEGQSSRGSGTIFLSEPKTLSWMALRLTTFALLKVYHREAFLDPYCLISMWQIFLKLLKKTVLHYRPLQTICHCTVHEQQNWRRARTRVLLWACSIRQFKTLVWKSTLKKPLQWSSARIGDRKLINKLTALSTAKIEGLYGDGISTAWCHRGQ